MANATFNILTAMIENQDGFTIIPETGTKFVPPVEAYLVGGVIPSLLITEVDENTFATIQRWYRDGVALTKGSIVDPVIGGWANEGTYYLDFTSVVFGKTFAIELGKARAELAIGHLTNSGEFTELTLA